MKHSKSSPTEIRTVPQQLELLYARRAAVERLIESLEEYARRKEAAPLLPERIRAA